MITNEERREIASRLRYVASDELGGMSLQKRLAKELELENTSWRGVLRGIADLIDRPTTTLTEDEDGRTHREPADSWEKLLGDLDRAANGETGEAECSYAGNAGITCKCCELDRFTDCTAHIFADIARRIRTLREVR